jgi:hypothetical protein
MKNFGQAARFCQGFALGWLAILCAWAPPLTAQSPAVHGPKPATGLASSTVPTVSHGAMDLDGPWRFRTGDDPRWADPSFDDSGWATVMLGRPLSQQGIASYTGYGWYRLRLRPEQISQFNNLSSKPPLDLLLTGYSIGQLAVYVNGVESGHTRGMTDRPAMYRSPPFAVHLSSPGADGTIVVAIRSWTGASVPVYHGLLDKAELGTQADVAERLTADADRLWDRQAISGMVVSFLFLCVAIIGMTLYLAQRKHSEYLWLALLCLSVAWMGTCEIVFSLGLLSWSVFLILNLWNGRVFMVVTLEFVLRFTESESRRLVRILQVYVVLAPVLYLAHLQLAYEYLGVSSEVIFSALVSVLLFRAWRRGRVDAGVMLLPFFMAASADSLDTVLGYAASKHWIADRFAYHRFHLGPIEFGTGTVTYTVFLGSLLAVILYRFIHVSQEEQRSAAEIEAARSVQALLIPTQLPSNRNFELESAYLPANGVGGDFFQVLPLQDGSMLVVVGDVSGKGLQAAMNACTLVGALRNELSHDPATVLNNLNQVLLGAVSGAGPGQKTAASFATCLCARVYANGKMTVANAGHLNPYRDGREMELAADLPLGVIGNIRYEQAAFQLKIGERLIFLSDGVVEATNAQGDLFGFERARQLANEPVRTIAETAKRFGQTDDITVVCLCFASHAVDGTGQQEALEGASLDRKP